MLDPAEYWHLNEEADNLAELEDRVRKYHKRSVVNPDETVDSPPREHFRAPFFLFKTTTREQVAELNELLEELWSINQRFVGERVAEVSAYYAITGEHLGLEHAFLTWCDTYMRHRADPSGITPQVANSPFLLSEKLVNEWYSIFGKVYLCENSVSSLFLYVPTLYTRWLLYDRLWKHLVYRIDKTRILVRGTNDPTWIRRIGGTVEKWGWLTDDLTPFLREVLAWAPAARLVEANALSNAMLRARIRGLAGDIHEMRPFLVRNFHPQKTITVLTPECAVAWEWHITNGIAVLCSGQNVAQVRKHIETVVTRFGVNVGYDGLLFDVNMPWSTTADLPDLDSTKPLALNYLILEHFHDLLYSFYEKIDFKRLRIPPRSRAEEPASSLDPLPEGVETGHPLPAEEGRVREFNTDDEAVAVVCHTLAESSEDPDEDEEADSHSVRRIPALRLQRVLRLFESRLGCEVGHGKGSEVNVYRPGGRIYTLGAHKRNREVHPLTVRRMLKVLKIPVAEFQTAVLG